MDKYFFLMAFSILPEISSTFETVDDFEVHVEITFRKRTHDPVPSRNKRIEGRTRAYRQLRSNPIDDDTLNVTKYDGEMLDNYSCLWVYQAHPVIFQTWKHMSEYAFDFQFNSE